MEKYLLFSRDVHSTYGTDWAFTSIISNTVANI